MCISTVEIENIRDVRDIKSSQTAAREANKIYVVINKFSGDYIFQGLFLNEKAARKMIEDLCKDGCYNVKDMILFSGSIDDLCQKHELKKEELSKITYRSELNKMAYGCEYCGNKTFKPKANSLWCLECDKEVIRENITTKQPIILFYAGEFNESVISPIKANESKGVKKNE
jgi:ribosomal protein L37AE/L43A